MKKPSTPLVKKLIQLTPEMSAWLEAESRRQTMPVNVFIRLLIAQAMKRKPLT